MQTNYEHLEEIRNSSQVDTSIPRNNKQIQVYLEINVYKQNVVLKGSSIITNRFKNMLSACYREEELN